MSWAYGGTDRFGREMGYAIQALCDYEGCFELIDRGLSYRCGDLDSMGGCGRYYCIRHLSGFDSKGDCDHTGSEAVGITICQPLKNLYDGVYCACHGDHPVTWPTFSEGVYT